MDVLEVVRKGIAEKVESDEACHHASKLNELWRMIKEALEVGMRVIVHVHTDLRHWRIGLNVDGLLCVDELVGCKEEDRYLIGVTPSDADSAAALYPLYPTVYPLAWAASLPFVKDLFSSTSVIRVEAETHAERFERERMSY